MKHIFMNGILFSGVAIACCSAHSAESYTFKNDLVLKTFSFDRDYKDSNSSDSSSLSQGFIYRGDWAMKIDQLQLHLMPSLQYAYRLSPD